MRFVIPAQPVAKGRPRFSTKGGTTRSYTPAKTRNAEAFIRLAVADALPQDWRPMEGPLELRVTTLLPMPKSIPKKRRDRALPIARPDVDNYLKLVADSCNGLLWRDDSQLVTVWLAKRYALDQPACWIVEVEAADRVDASPIRSA